ncbi:MAG: hypothetical protein AAB573_03830 [Patescibacteria group bacterium]
METIVKKLKHPRPRLYGNGRSRQVLDVNWFKRANWNEISHVVSIVDERPKASYGYIDCVGVAAVGTDKKTGKNISLLSHQSPRVLTDKKGQGFERDLTAGLKDLKERSKPGTVEVSIIGGQERKKWETDNAYPRLAAQVHTITKSITGRKARVVVPPSGVDMEPQHAVLDTKRNRLHIFVGKWAYPPL